MANIDTYLAQIRSAIYGEEVRGSIINALEAQNNETENNTVTAEQALADAQTAITNAQTAADTANTAAANADSSGENAVKIAQDAADSAQKTADDAAAAATQTASDAADEAVKIAQNAADEATQTASDAADEAVRIATEAAENAQNTAYTAAENANTAAELANAAAENMIDSYDITYQASSIGTSAPTGEWTHSIPSVADGNYLWTRIEFTLLNEEVITAYSVAKNGGTSEGGGGGSLWYGTCETESGTATKTVPCDGFTLDSGTEIIVNFYYTNTASNATLNVNNTGSYPIFYKGVAIEAGLLQSESTYLFVFSGAHYDVVGILETEIEEISTSTIDSWFE